jgi:hypothetical protein
VEHESTDQGRSVSSHPAGDQDLVTSLPTSCQHPSKTVNVVEQPLFHRFVRIFEREPHDGRREELLVRRLVFLGAKDDDVEA